MSFSFPFKLANYWRVDTKRKLENCVIRKGKAGVICLAISWSWFHHNKSAAAKAVCHFSCFLQLHHFLMSWKQSALCCCYNDWMPSQQFLLGNLHILVSIKKLLNWLVCFFGVFPLLHRFFFLWDQGCRNSFLPPTKEPPISWLIRWLFSFDFFSN